jgi:hypothetical protein
MIGARFADAVRVDPPGMGSYQPGVCNIGPAEIRRRRRTGHVGLAASVGLLAVIIAIDAPREARLLVGIPAMLSASGYIQAALKFCAGYGWLGVFNFGEAGRQEEVRDADARRRDRVRALSISGAAFGIGLVVALAGFALPI